MPAAERRSPPLSEPLQHLAAILDPTAPQLKLEAVAVGRSTGADQVPPAWRVAPRMRPPVSQTATSSPRLSKAIWGDSACSHDRERSTAGATRAPRRRLRRPPSPAPAGQARSPTGLGAPPRGPSPGRAVPPDPRAFPRARAGGGLERASVGPAGPVGSAARSPPGRFGRPTRPRRPGQARSRHARTALDIRPPDDPFRAARDSVARWIGMVIQRINTSPAAVC